MLYKVLYGTISISDAKRDRGRAEKPLQKTIK